MLYDVLTGKIIPLVTLLVHTSDYHIFGYIDNSLLWLLLFMTRFSIVSTVWSVNTRGMSAQSLTEHEYHLYLSMIVVPGIKLMRELLSIHIQPYALKISNSSLSHHLDTWNIQMVLTWPFIVLPRRKVISISSVLIERGF